MLGDQRIAATVSKGDVQQSHDSIVLGRELVQLEVGHVEDRRGLAGWHAPHGKVTVLGQEPVTSRPGR